MLIRSGPRGNAADWSPRLIPTDSPWQRRHLVRLGLWMSVGLIGLAVSWYRVSGEGNEGDQIPWLVVGIVALAISGLGTVGWLMAASRAVHLEAFDVMSQLRDQCRVDVATSEFVGSDPDSRPDAAAGADDRLVAGPTMTRAHRRDCALVAGKPVAPVEDHELAARGLTRCGVCCDE